MSLARSTGAVHADGCRRASEPSGAWCKPPAGASNVDLPEGGVGQVDHDQADQQPSEVPPRAGRRGARLRAHPPRLDIRRARRAGRATAILRRPVPRGLPTGHCVRLQARRPQPVEARVRTGRKVYELPEVWPACYEEIVHRIEQGELPLPVVTNPGPLLPTPRACGQGCDRRDRPINRTNLETTVLWLAEDEDQATRRARSAACVPELGERYARVAHI
jgi:hypothetical protein